ncbi:MAG: hypothetical protein J5822_03015 [Eubacteriaceae bacterium]|nr:hypothetical protein [Eubacteriaceae bacterium]
MDINDDTKILVEYHVGIQMFDSGNASTVINDLAFDPEIHKLIITEEYTAGYKQDGDIQLTPNEDETVWTATVKNLPDKPIYTSGIINVYEDGTYQDPSTTKKVETVEPQPEPVTEEPQEEVDESEDHEEPDEE